MAELEFENASSFSLDELPGENDFALWFKTALPVHKLGAVMCLRLMNPEEIQTLNNQYRRINSPTNVLSFPCRLPKDVDLQLIGDLAICPQVVKQEAVAQNKSETAHWAHMVIHGTLHLLGYDHVNDDDARIMEQLETQFLSTLGYDDPYQLYL